MKAYVIESPGGPENLTLRDLPTPEAEPGWVLIRVRAFGLNRSEWFTRRGESPTVKFPRVLGIECVGEVERDGDELLPRGQKVAAMMGGMGRQFNGSYAEYTRVPGQLVFPLKTELPWEKLGALPEMLQTTHGSLQSALEIERAKNLLIRGGTSSIGFAALSLAKTRGLRVVSTTRNSSKRQELLGAGADDVVIDHGTIANAASKMSDGSFDRVLELIGTTTLLDSLKCTRRGGIVCMTGILGGRWAMENFRPMGDIPTAVKLTSYAGESSDITQEELQRYVSLVEADELKLKLGPVFRFEDLQDAHRLMDSNRANGKIVVMH